MVKKRSVVNIILFFARQEIAEVGPQPVASSLINNCIAKPANKDKVITTTAGADPVPIAKPPANTRALVGWLYADFTAKSLKLVEVLQSTTACGPNANIPPDTFPRKHLSNPSAPICWAVSSAEQQPLQSLSWFKICVFKESDRLILPQHFPPTAHGRTAGFLAST